MLKKENIPAEAITIHNQNEQYRKFITSLDYTVDSYNKILRTASAEEKPLIQNEMEKIDMAIKTLEEAINSNDRDYIIECSKNFENITEHFLSERLNSATLDLLKGKHIDEIN